MNALRCPYFRKAFGWSAPIGGLAGLIGLGGGEFRLPVLIHVIGFNARTAIPLNLLVSLVTLGFAFAIRSGSIPLAALANFLPAMAGLAVGGCVSAICGVWLVRRLSDARLVRLTALLLAALGLLLLAEAAFPFPAGTVLAPDRLIHFGAGVVIGLGVGIVSSVLGIAGGELLIPALMLLFGADVKTAGSASIVISLVIVLVGLWRHAAAGNLVLSSGPRRIVGAMSAGSIVGALVGGLIVAIAPVVFLKVLLGAVLIAAAIKTLRHEPQ